MELNVFDFLTAKDQAIVSEALTNKMLDIIDNIHIKISDLDMTPLFKKLIKDVFISDDVFDQIEYQQLGTHLTKVLIKNIK